ncbi:hypothetical protein E4U41_003426 [Claviceps citrina]|nr:hypothetical protein E4U41_003426 [Claviceps citrina]
MYAAFDGVDSESEDSWNYKQPAKTAEMIYEPYPLLMNAIKGVNLSAACILTSTENAQNLGIPKRKWVYVLGGAGTHERDDFK